MNLPTALVLLLLAVLVAGALYAMHRRRKQSGHCGGCPLSGYCRKTNTGQ